MLFCVDDAESSTAGSVSQTEIKEIVNAQVNIMQTTLQRGWDDRFDQLASTLMSAINKNKPDNDIIPDHVTNPTFSAPQSVPVLKPRSRVLDPSPSKPPTGSQCLEADRVEPVQGGVNPSPIVSPQVTETLKSLDALRASGVLSSDGYFCAIAKGVLKLKRNGLLHDKNDFFPFVLLRSADRRPYVNNTSK